MKQGYPRYPLRIAGFHLFLLLVAIPVSVSASSRFVFAANYIAGSVSTYRVDADTGMLHHIRFTPTLQNPSTLVLRPDGKYLYVTSQVLDKIAIYRVDKQSGVLTEIKSSPIDSGVRSNFRLAMSPDSKLLYVPGRFTSNLMVFRSHPETGELIPLEDNNFSTHGKRTRYVEVSPDGRFVYVTNTNSNSLAAFKVDIESQSIEPVEGMPFEVSHAPQAAMVHPSGKYLYIPNWQAEKLSGFTINQDTGALTPIADFKAPTGVFPFSGSIHPSGQYLYVANWLSYDVSGFSIDENTGHLTSIEGMPIATEGAAPVNVRLDKEGQFAYVPNYHDSSLTVFKVDGKTGRLINPRRVISRPGVRRLAILEGEPVRYESRWMVVTETDRETGKNSISSYALDAKTGELVVGHSESLKELSAALALQQEAGLVFTSQSKSVVVFRLTKNGKLKKLVNTDITPNGDIQALYVDQRGRHLYVTTSNPNQYLAYEINAENGKLKEVERVELPEGVLPKQITASPEQRLNFVRDEALDQIFVYRFIDRFGPNAFQLDRHGSPFKMEKGLSDILIDTTGQFGLVVQSEKGSVGVYRMPTIWGPLLPLKSSPISVGKKPVAITIHPNGSYLYALDAGGNYIQQLRLNTETGELKLVSQAMTVKGVPKTLSIDPSGRFAYLQYASRKGLTRFEIDGATGQLSYSSDVLEGITPSALVFTVSIQ